MSTELNLVDMTPVATIHHRAAQRCAHRLFTFTSSVFPKEWILDARDDFVQDLFEFAYHGYRLCEIVDIKTGDIDISAGDTIHFAQIPPWPWETDYRKCLNAIRHCNSIKFGNATAPQSRQLFSQNENLMAAFVVLTTDKFSEQRSIPIFALSYSYLHYVRPKIVEFLKKPRNHDNGKNP